MKCTHCGNENQPDALFCDQCGTRLTAAADAAADVVMAAPTAAEPAAPMPAASTAAASAAAASTPPGLCTQCGAANTPGEMFCAECGAPLKAPAPEKVAPATPEPLAETAPSAVIGAACPQCGAELEPGDAFCAKCGAALEAPPPTVAQAAPMQTAPGAQAAADAQAPAEQPQPAQPAAAPLTECPSCGADVAPDDAFCDFCGAALVGDAAAMPRPASPPATMIATPLPAAAPSPQPAAGPYLLVVASGLALPLPDSGEALIGREDPLSNTFPEVDLTPHGGEEGGVSRRHFKITLGEGQYAIQDLNSTNSTWLNRTRLQPGLPVALHDGDEIRAGRVRLQFHAG